jgi:hypothetical protein
MCIYPHSYSYSHHLGVCRTILTILLLFMGMVCYCWLK